jgi:thioredoxin reductase (NADPH)
MEVTMIIRAEQIGERVKYWVRPDIENRIREGSIKAYFNSNVTQITPHTITITTPHGLVTIDNDWVIAMSGYVPDTSFLQSCGIRLTDNATRKPEYNPDTFETNVPVYSLPALYVADWIPIPILLKTVRTRYYNHAYHQKQK